MFAPQHLVYYSNDNYFGSNRNVSIFVLAYDSSSCIWFYSILSLSAKKTKGIIGINHYIRR
jgi:hypothetical protein